MMPVAEIIAGVKFIGDLLLQLHKILNCYRVGSEGLSQLRTSLDIWLADLDIWTSIISTSILPAEEQ